MELVLATQNKDKIAEIKSIMSGLDLEILTLDDFENIPEVIEDCLTYEGNALKKARVISESTGIPALADDSGISIEYLGGAPGVYSARYAGIDCTYEDNNRKLLRELKNVPAKFRKGVFETIAVLYLPGGEHYATHGELEGFITTEPRGEKGFGYDPIFELHDRRTLAELPPSEKNEISHRAKAFGKMKEVIEKLTEK